MYPVQARSGERGAGGGGVVIGNVLVFLLLLVCLVRMSLLFWSLYFALTGRFLEALACFGAVYIARILGDPINERIPA